jgi:hypothetical protein
VLVLESNSYVMEFVPRCLMKSKEKPHNQEQDCLFSRPGALFVPSCGTSSCQSIPTLAFGAFPIAGSCESQIFKFRENRATREFAVHLR